MNKKTLKNVINKENFQIKSADLVQKLIQKQENTLISDLETLINIIFTNFQDLKVFEQAYRIGLISRIAVNNQKILEKGQSLQNQEINILDKMIKYLGYSRMSPSTILITDFNRFIASTFKNTEASLVKILKKEKLLDKKFLFTLVYTDLKPYFILDQKLYEKALKAMHDRQYIEEKE
ncbi:hypothetical protein PPERSA_02774 [Pseudocohnilembus persalinus]|uniref:Uncharacterized protein n=1 Tax=Pseudocohnilembus persalinus TaxID=266149 RepID=A0A0V0Q8Q6_PSEPJ|nr:hypothetical protein PPERSA_02774 [Pseudocohnilembus persalinus]|eukprot:KRW98626.1 hypothetical protein PPERSA_02774 [Pseudocohnilembus persalinus]